MKRVLVIDDSQVIRRLLTDFLTDLGFEVDLAENGLDGVEMACRDHYDLIICDVHMPKKNGCQVFQEVTAHDPEARFLMTDSLPGDLAEQPKKIDMKYLLAKPFDLDILRKTIDEVMQEVKIT